MVHLRALFEHPAAHRVFQHHVTRDAEIARLSRMLQSYYALRRFLPIGVRQLLQCTFRKTPTDGWIFPDAFLRDLRRALRDLTGLLTIHPWPCNARIAVVLTHDVETASGLKDALKIARLEEKLGFRSSWNLVPHKYPIDDGIIRELRARSFEIGIHGYNHDGRLYRSRKVFEKRVPLINQALRCFGAVGFRSPMVHRNLQWLQSLDIEYDSSCFDIDPFQPMPGGVGSLWPFSFGRFVELPYTLPQDHTLWVVLRLHDCKLWEQKLHAIAAHQGMALMLTHPDYLSTPRHLELYERFLGNLRRTAGAWNALPKDVATWWREREQSRIVGDEAGQVFINGPARDRGVIASVEMQEGRLNFRAVSAARLDESRSRSSQSDGRIVRASRETVR